MNEGRRVCNNPYCESTPNWFGNFALCTKCLYEAANVFVMNKLLEKTLSGLKEGSE